MHFDVPLTQIGWNTKVCTAGKALLEVRDDCPGGGGIYPRVDERDFLASRDGE